MWRTAKLGDLLEVQNGYAFNSRQFDAEGDMPLIRIRDLKNAIHTETRYTGKYDEKYVVEKGDLLIGMDGEFRCYEWRGESALLNQRVCRLQKFHADLNQRFLLYAINDELKKIEDVTGFTTVKHLSSKTIKEIELPLPPLAEQQRIVAKLDAAFAEIDRAIEVAQETKLIASKIADASVKSTLANQRFEWQTIDLGDISENLDSKRVPITKSKRAEGNVPYYGASGIVDYVDGHLFDEELLLISEDGANLLMRTYPIAFSVSGKIWVNNHAHVLRFADRNTQQWVERYVNATNLTKFISGMAQPKLNQKRLNSIPIPLPNEKYMNELLSVMDMTKQKGDELDGVQSEKAVQLVKLKSAILTQELQPPQSEAA